MQLMLHIASSSAVSDRYPEVILATSIPGTVSYVVFDQTFEVNANDEYTLRNTVLNGHDNIISIEIISKAEYSRRISW